jgi:hypothetical protein
MIDFLGESSLFVESELRIGDSSKTTMSETAAYGGMSISIFIDSETSDNSPHNERKFSLTFRQRACGDTSSEIVCG